MDYYGEIKKVSGYFTKKLSISQTSQIFKFILEYSPEINKHREKIIEFSGNTKSKIIAKMTPNLSFFKLS